MLPAHREFLKWHALHKSTFYIRLLTHLFKDVTSDDWNVSPRALHTLEHRTLWPLGNVQSAYNDFSQCVLQTTELSCRRNSQAVTTGVARRRQWRLESPNRRLIVAQMTDQSRPAGRESSAIWRQVAVSDLREPRPTTTAGPSAGRWISGHRYGGETCGRCRLISEVGQLGTCRRIKNTVGSG